VSQDKLIETVKGWIGRWKIGGDNHFFTPKEWQKRGEEIGSYADLTLTCEGQLNHILNGYVSDSRHLIDDFSRVVNGTGYYWEWGYAWSVHFYKMEEKKS
jgi:hypothetical protein